MPRRSLSVLSLLLLVAGCVITPPEPPGNPDTDFPDYAIVDIGSPTLEFQVCDSKPADINADGTLDLIMANHIDPGFGYFMGIPGGPADFADGQTVDFVAGGNSAGIVAVDLNGDGMLDVANSDHPGEVTIRINGTTPGAGIDEVVFPDSGETDIDLGLDHEHVFGVAGVEGGLIAADYNGDGLIDLATSNLGDNTAGDTTASFLLNTTPQGASAATFAPVQYKSLPAAAISIDQADFNDDGKPDIVTSNTADGSLTVLTNRTEDGSMTIDFERLDIEIPAQGNEHGAGPTNPLAIDLDGDGLPDLASANWNTSTISVFLNTTDTSTPGASPTFGPATLIELQLNPLLVRSADIDQDGDEDLVIIPLAMGSGVGATVIENNSTPGAAAFVVDWNYALPEEMRTTFPNAWFTTAGNVHDFDGDGAPEIAVAVARGSFTLEAFELIPADNVLGYIDPALIPVSVIDQFLPGHTELVLYEIQ